MNFQRKHSKKVPLPKLYMDEDTLDSEGLELQDGSVVGRKATGGSSGSGKLGRKPSTGGSSSGEAGGSGGDGIGSSSGSASTSGGSSVGGPEATTQAGVESVAMMMIRMMIPTSEGRPANLPSHQDSRWQGRSHERANQCMVVNTSAQECDRVSLIPQLIETWLPSTCHVPKRGPSWVSICWTGPRLNWRRCTRRG